MVEVGDVVIFRMPDGVTDRPGVVTRLWGQWCVNLRVITEPEDQSNCGNSTMFFSSVTSSEGEEPFARSFREKPNTEALRKRLEDLISLIEEAQRNALKPVTQINMTAAPSVTAPPTVSEVIPQSAAPAPAEAATPAPAGDAVEGAQSPA